MIRLQVQQLSKAYRKTSRPAVSEVSFALPEGGLMALVGESGSGKTTLLRLLAGLETPDQGEIRLEDRLLSSPRRVIPPEQRGIGLVFQHHALFPHLSVAANITYGLRRLPAAARQDKLRQLLDLTGLGQHAGRYPHELSGGEKQRVALARALAPEPRVLLLDEPFSSLDARLRQRMREETRRLLRQQGVTAIFVTHDTQDALSIADHLVVLKEGRVQQQGRPAEIYQQPANAYTAAFFGPCNVLPRRSLALPAGAPDPPGIIGPPAAPERADEVWVRPENLRLTPPGSAAALLTGTVLHASYQGASQSVVLSCPDAAGQSFEITVQHPPQPPVQSGEAWGIGLR